jgi:RNA polymerase sigma-70 factor (sigma-E family)
VPSASDADFTAFVAGASRRLLRSAYLISGDAGVAEDLLQTALERAYRRWCHVRREGAPEAYVRRIIVNTATDWWRREHRLRSVPLDDSSFPAVNDLRLDSLNVREQLLAGLRQLPLGQRAVLVLRYFDDLTEAETARTLGCSVGTVKSQHARAMARLRELLPDGRSA